MNLITRTIPALVLGLSGLTLSGASQADSGFSVTISNGYALPRISYAYHDSYAPPGRACNIYRRHPVHVDHYVQKYVYRDYRHSRRHHRDDDRADRHEYRENRDHDRGHDRDSRHSRKHSDRNDRRRHSGYAVSARY